MKKCLPVLIGCLILSTILTKGARAQSFEAQQLLLNVEKLAQLKQILSDLKKGYEIVSAGYTTIKNISEGNFKLHQVFLDGLLQVSPAVKKYKRVKEIMDDQLSLVKEYRQALRRFQNDSNFSRDEIDYIGKVYANLFSESLKNLDALLTIITAHRLRMSDAERLKAIDHIYTEMQDKLLFLRHFNRETTLLALQRVRERKDVEVAQRIYGITK